MTSGADLDSAGKISLVIQAIQNGFLQVRAEDADWIRQLIELPRGITGLVDISSLSPEVLAKARATASALTFFQQEESEKMRGDLNLNEAQCELFQLFGNLFETLVDASADIVASEQEIKDRLLYRIRQNESFEKFNDAASELEQFYKKNAGEIFELAKSIGGVKVVSGGQRRFGSSALTATRIAGLYCDTQLIPDPVYPFLSGSLNLTAMHLQLAMVLFYILQLRPLVDARLPVPPVFVFPSFEEVLEENDAVTQLGIASLLVKVVAPACGKNFATIEEAFEYAQSNEDGFLSDILRNRLFVPPGEDPKKNFSVDEARNIYLSEAKRTRSEKIFSEMLKIPNGPLLLNGVLERLRPQYHLLENAGELGAQPMLSQDVHWHYFEICAAAEARDLVNEKVISPGSLDILRTLQDDSLTWLANIPINGLAVLRENLEHVEFREQLKKHTTQLASAGPAELEAVTREVNHGLAVMIQLQQRKIREIEAKYAPKKWAAATGGALATVAGASMFFLPALAAFSGVGAPIAAAVAGVGVGGATFVKESVGMFVEKRQARKSLLGFLAKAQLKR